MRQIVLDTETTGLEWRQGHRLVEIACVEMIGRRPTGNNYQTYINPQRAMDAEASEVTGIKDEQLIDKPLFAQVVDEFLAFIGDSELIIHNANFDVGFLDSELARMGAQYGTIRGRCPVLDTLAMARERYPGQRNSLDALCKRLGVDNSARDLHGGLIDAQLLAEVYLAMTSGQVMLDLGGSDNKENGARAVIAPVVLSRRPRVLRASDDELAAHVRRLDALDKSAGGQSVWRKLESEA